jgi:hypothetical protein
MPVNDNHPVLPMVETTVIGADHVSHDPGEFKTLGNQDLYDAIITADYWPTMSQEIKDRIEMDLTAAGYRLNQCWAVEYQGGRLHRVTVVVRA